MNRKGCLEFVRAIESLDTLKSLLRAEIASAPEKAECVRELLGWTAPLKSFRIA